MLGAEDVDALDDLFGLDSEVVVLAPASSCGASVTSVDLTTGHGRLMCDRDVGCLQRINNGCR